jgi:hypothetical protein
LLVSSAAIHKHVSTLLYRAALPKQDFTPSGLAGQGQFPPIFFLARRWTPLLMWVIPLSCLGRRPRTAEFHRLLPLAEFLSWPVPPRRIRPVRPTFWKG